MEASRFPRVAAGARRLRLSLTALALAESRARGLLVGLALFGAGIGARSLLGMQGFPFLTSFPAIILGALFGGATVGAIITGLSALTAWLFFIPTHSPPGPHSQADAVALGSFVLIGTALVLLIDQLSTALREAEATRRRADEALAGQRSMFLEFQHRVANGLQAAASLLALERRRLGHEGADPATMLEEAAGRLQAMARLHRRLYDPEAAQRDFIGVVEGVCSELKIAFGAEAVVFQVDVPAQLPIGISRLLPLGLVVAEAVTNSLKHGLGDGRPGTIVVRITTTPVGYELLVRDDGPDQPPRAASEGSHDDLGLLVLRSLAQRLGGRLELLNEGGAVTRVTFPVGVPA